MTQRNGRREIRSRQERAVTPSSPPVVQQPPENGEAPPDLDQLRRIADAQGFALSRKKTPQRGRPEAEGGRIRTTCSMSVPIRDAIEKARYELHLTFSEIIERALFYYLENQGFQVDGSPPPENTGR